MTNIILAILLTHYISMSLAVGKVRLPTYWWGFTFYLLFLRGKQILKSMENI